MKKIITLSFCFLLFLAARAQNQSLNPVTWTASYQSISATEGVIIINATIEKGWHTYSQRATTDGPVPTAFTFPPSKQYQLVGKTDESEAHEEMDPAFGAKTFSHAGKAEFKQKIKFSGKGGFPITFNVEYMCCDNNRCLPPKTVELSVKVQ